jgi:starch phosphorylase
LFKPIMDSLLYHDEYMLLADYAAYIDISEQAAHAFATDPDGWTRSSILNCARGGYFSSDRSILDYCQQIWKVQPINLE